jgi:hypothetical protein
LSTKPVSGGGNRGAPERADTAVPLAERAAAAADAELRGERSGILGAIGRSTLSPLARPRRVPDRWSFFHVMARMEEGFRTLSRLPLPTRPRGYINSMPVYLYDRADLNSQLETHELERMARIRNRVGALALSVGAEAKAQPFCLCWASSMIPVGADNKNESGGAFAPPPS